MSPRAHRLGTVVLYALLAIAALALPLEATQPFHVHHGDTAGLYNGECTLAVLAAFQGPAPLPSPAASVSSALLAGPAPLVPAVGLAVGLARHTDSRAPPLV